MFTVKIGKLVVLETMMSLNTVSPPLSLLNLQELLQASPLYLPGSL